MGFTKGTPAHKQVAEKKRIADVKGREEYRERIGRDPTQALLKKDGTPRKPPGRPKGIKAFHKVREARELLAQSAVFAVKKIKTAAKVAAEKGDSAPAEFLLKHASAVDEQGKLIRPIESSVDKISDGVSNAPTINIGWISPREPVQIPAIEVQSLPAHIDDDNG